MGQNMTGKEIMQGIKDGVFPMPTMATTIPMKIMAVEEGAIEFQARATHRHLNPMGGVHGGFAATVLDTATGAAVHTMLKHKESYGTVDLNVKMLKPIPPEMLLRAKGRVLHISNRIGMSEATLTDDDGRIYAHATSTCMILRKE